MRLPPVKHAAFDASELLVESDDANVESHRAAMEMHGYAVLRNFMDRKVLRAARDAVLEVLERNRAIERTSDGDYNIVTPHYSEEDTGLLAILQAVLCRTELYDIVSQPRVGEFFTSFFGEPVRFHPIIVPRVVFPTPDDMLWTLVAPHQDYSSIQGDPRFVTIWVALDDCPREVGPLRLALGTARSDLLDYRIADTGGYEADLGSGTRWGSTDLEAGDVICFSSHMVHSPTQNVSSRLRMSIDFRVQPASGPLSSAAIPDPVYLYGLSARQVYSRVSNSFLKYNWRREGAEIVPFDKSKVNGPRMSIEQLVARLENGDKRVLPVLYKLRNHAESVAIRTEARRVLTKHEMRTATDLRVAT